MLENKVEEERELMAFNAEVVRAQKELANRDLRDIDGNLQMSDEEGQVPKCPPSITKDDIFNFAKDSFQSLVAESNQSTANFGKPSSQPLKSGPIQTHFAQQDKKRNSKRKQQSSDLNKSILSLNYKQG